MALCCRVTGCVLAFVLLVSSGASATHAPATDPTRPGPYYFEVENPLPSLQAIENGTMNRTTGTVASLTNQHVGPFVGSPEEAARAYLDSRAQNFGITRVGADLILDQVQEAPGGIHVTLRQAVDGVPVWRSEVVVSFDAAGQYVRAVANSFDPFVGNAGLNTRPILTADEAKAIALKAIGVFSGPDWMGDPTTKLWIVRDQDLAGAQAHLAWRITLPVQQPMGDWEVFVDARSGSVVRLMDQELFVDGSGMTFDPDPLTTAQVAYGGVYVDNNDADVPELNAQRVSHVLPNLAQQGGLYYLRGDWAYADDFESPTIAPPSAADPNSGFNFTRSPDGFEYVNAWWNITESQIYMQALGFNTIQHAPIHFDAHGLSGQDNSHYIPSANRIAYGDGGVDDAEDADVVRHEYGHAIQSSIRPGWGGGQEGSMGEGFGDYWACSYSASISSFHNDWVFNWDGHNPFWPGRVVNSTLGYNNINGDIYHDGTIWASCWWLIHAECGRIVTDTDMLKMHFYMSTNNTMPQAAAFAMQADKDLYQGLHSGSLDYYFTLRNFWTATQYDVPTLTTTPLPDTVWAAGPFAVTVVVQSTSAIVAGSVKVKFGIGGAFDQEAVLNPTGNPNEWGGFIPDQGGNVEIRYYIIADNAATWRGAAPRGAEYQYYHFFAANSAAVNDPMAAGSLKLRVTSPNPTHNLASLTFELPRAGTARLGMYDLSGRLVSVLASGQLAAGAHAYLWDGRSQGGNSVPSGLYFARLTAEGKELTQKVMLMK